MLVYRFKFEINFQKADVNFTDVNFVYYQRKFIRFLSQLGLTNSGVYDRI